MLSGGPRTQHESGEVGAGVGEEAQGGGCGRAAKQVEGLQGGQMWEGCLEGGVIYSAAACQV